MPHRVKLISGFLLIGLGVLGLLLPLMPGIPLLLAGLALVGTDHPWVRPFKARLVAWRRKLRRTNEPSSGEEG
jgi:uncharacterized membrane protein YbaN (DUF454 family)